MSYTCYLGGALWPTPRKAPGENQGKNKTLVLLNEGEVNFLQAPASQSSPSPLTCPCSPAPGPRTTTWDCWSR